MMRSAQPQVTPERGYALPQPVGTSPRQPDAGSRCSPYERSYELRRGYELPADSARSLAEPRPERPC